MRIGALDDLAVHLQDEPQHAMRRRMLRPEIDRVAVDLRRRRRARRRPVGDRRRARSCVAHDAVPAASGRAVARRGPAFSSPGRRCHALPRRQEIEAAEFLLQPHRLVDDPLLLLVVAHLDIAGQREILAQRMPLETVIGQDAAQIGMAGEEDAEQIPGLALPPAGRAEQPGAPTAPASPRRSSTLTRRRWLSCTLQQVVDDVEALRRGRDNRRRRCRMSSVKRHFGSSRRNRQHAQQRLALDRDSISSPRRISVAVTAPGSAAATCSASAASLSGMSLISAENRPCAADLLLQLQDAVEQRLGGRRAARHIDVDRHDAVAAAHHRIGIVVIAAAIGAAAHAR